jgi:hypothetical protein
MLLPVPVVTVRIDKITRDRGDYALHIGRVLRVEHWDRKRQRPR